MIVGVMAFGLARLVQMVHHEGAQITITTVEDYYNETFVYDSRTDNFTVALCLSDGSFDPAADDLDYGRVQMRYIIWDPVNQYELVTLPTRPCTLDDFGLGPDPTKRKFVNPPDSINPDSIDRFICID
jgi:hypothetical protein